MTLQFHLSEADTKLNFKMSVNTSGGVPYTGDYTVYPDVHDIVLPTAQKTMVEDLTVKKIPLAEVGNLYGTTIVIGGR